MHCNNNKNNLDVYARRWKSKINIVLGEWEIMFSFLWKFTVQLNQFSCFTVFFVKLYSILFIVNTQHNEKRRDDEILIWQWNKLITY